jgi:hypothetical protein
VKGFKLLKIKIWKLSIFVLSFILLSFYLPISSSVIININSPKSYVNEIIIDENLSITNSDESEFWAICIGIRDGDAQSDDPFVDEAKEIKNVLLDHGWQENHIKLLVGKVTKEEISDALSYIEERAGPSDTVLFFITSHGGVINGKGYVCIWVQTEGGRYWHDELYYKDLDTKLDNLNVGGQIVVISACQSGSAIEPLKDDGRIVITSCDTNEYALGKIFTSLFAMGLNIGDCIGNNDGVTTAEEAFTSTFEYIATDWPYSFYPQIGDQTKDDISFVYERWRKGRVDQYNLHYPFSSNSEDDISCNRMLAQSFTPNCNKLYRVGLLIDDTYREILSPLTISIRDKIDGNDITSSTLAVSDLDFLPGYYEFILPQTIDTVPGETYYIIIKTDAPEENYFSLVPNKNDYYNRGDMYHSTNGGESWTKNEYVYDISFITFGKSDNNNQPYVPKRPFGPNIGKPGSSMEFFVSTKDVDGDPVSYFIDWGDGSNSNWRGPYSSGEVTSISHTWNQKGRYYIKVKAKDKHGAQSSYSSVLKVEIHSDPDLKCNGSLGWNNIKPAETIKGSFTVENVGETGSALSWEIVSSPNWGKWVFNPPSGNGLKPNNRPVIVDVEVKAPDEKGKWGGEVKIVNVDNPEDYDIVTVSLTTPRVKTANIPFLKFLENYPIIYKLFQRFFNF